MLTRKLFLFVSRFFSPNLPPETPVWYRSRLTMFASGVVLLFYFFQELIFHLITPLDPISFSRALIILGGTASLLSGFLLAKMGRVLPAIWFTVGGWTLDVLLDPFMGETRRSGASLEIWLIFGLLIAFILLSFRQFVFFATAQTLLAWLAIWLWQRNSLDITSNMEIHLATVILLGVGLWLREHEQLQREEMALALHKQKEYLQEIIDSIQSPFYVVDIKDYRVRLANRAARATGLIEGVTTCYALTHLRTQPCSGEEHPCPLQHVRDERRPYTTEHIHYRADGSTFHAEVHGYPLFDENGRVVQMVEYALDISERKRAEAEIRKLMQAVEHAASGVIITDPKGIIEYVNPAFEQMTGYRREEVIGQTPRLLKSGKNPRELYAELWKTILSGRVWRGEIVNRRKDGSLYWELQTIAPVIVNEQIVNFVGIKLDITRQKELEQQLIEAKENAEAASAFKSRLLSNVSHDMRTPLGAILGYAELIRDGTYGPVNEQQRQILEIIIRYVHRLTSFVNGMLIRAELESGKLRLRKRFFAPAELLKAVYLYRVLAEGKGLIFEEAIDPSLPAQLYGDPYWLEQILTNLTDNAIKYTDSGRIQVYLKRVDEAHWSIQVQDSGVGIPLEKQKQIFEPFYQVADTSDPRRSGVGLGLSIVKELAERMGGELHLESSPGSGSTFRVVLPFERFPDVS